MCLTKSWCCFYGWCLSVVEEVLNTRRQIICDYVTHTTPLDVKMAYASFAGSLLNLAKHPSSTVQILGAEKALFRALKTKHDTPKYGLIYHASLVGQANQKLKGKVGSWKLLTLNGINVNFFLVYAWNYCNKETWWWTFMYLLLDVQNACC